jgi:hypothetical protein
VDKPKIAPEFVPEDVKPVVEPVKPVKASEFDDMQGFTRDALLKMEKEGTNRMKCRDGIMRNIQNGRVVANEDEKPEEVVKTAEAETKPVTVEGTEVTITASEYAEFKLAKEELVLKQASETVTSLVFNDKIGLRMPTESKDSLVSFYLKLNESMKTEFTAILEKIPASKIFGEVGDAGDSVTGESAYAKIGEIADKLMSEEKLNSGQAYTKARRLNPELAKLANEYNQSLRSKK